MVKNGEGVMVGSEVALKVREGDGEIVGLDDKETVAKEGEAVDERMEVTLS